MAPSILNNKKWPRLLCLLSKTEELERSIGFILILYGTSRWCACKNICFDISNIIGDTIVVDTMSKV